jgi:hypothetical protein
MVWQFFSIEGRKHHFDAYSEDHEMEQFVQKDFDSLDLHEKRVVADASQYLYPGLSQQEDWKMFHEE